jgi:hypothetical protein
MTGALRERLKRAIKRGCQFRELVTVDVLDIEVAYTELLLLWADEIEHCRLDSHTEDVWGWIDGETPPDRMEWRLRLVVRS